ncbi:TPA: ankyrin repeat domain-containing protein [Citrobacter farmeri]|nr:ankyrin repeat domain-containing protein [Citrobacter farmeri]
METIEQYNELTKEYNEISLIDALVIVSTRSNNKKLVADLISNGADVNTAGGQALASACLNGFFDMAKFLIENGAEINHTHMANACLNRRFSIIELLASKGADIHYQNDWAMKEAIESGNPSNIHLVKSFY